MLIILIFVFSINFCIHIFQKEVLKAMGQQNSPLNTLKSSTPELQLIDINLDLYMNVRSGRIYVKNEAIVGNIQDVQYELDIYKFRRLNDNYVVSVDYCSIDTQQDFCSSFSSIHYYIEKQDYTLFQRQELKIQEGLKLLIHILKAFEILYDKFGYFTPSAKMIFFNHFHHPKVWFHEDPKVTKNQHNSNNHKSISLENNFLQEIIRLFDCLRDPQNPLFRYSEHLPNQLLTFKLVNELFIRKQAEMTINRRRWESPFTQIHNIRRYLSPYIQQPKTIVSLSTSPTHSPRFTIPTHLDDKGQKEYSKMPKMKIAYCSPQKPTVPNDLTQFKESVKTSLKKMSCCSNFGHKINPSVEFTSTMPNSLRNSRSQERNILIELLNPVVSSSSSSVTPLDTKCGALKKQASQRYSEIQPTSFGRHLLKNSEMEQKSARKAVGDQSQIILESMPVEQTQSLKTQKENLIFNQQLSFRRDYQTHKRHRTDYKILQKSNTSKSSMNQKSAVDGGFMQNFNCNTIKSIHLLDEDREADNDIIVDLKQIINKYRLGGSKT